MSDAQLLIPGKLRLDVVERWLGLQPLRLVMDEAFWPGVQAAADLVAAAAAGARPVYGINTLPSISFARRSRGMAAGSGAGGSAGCGAGRA